MKFKGVTSFILCVVMLFVSTFTVMATEVTEPVTAPLSSSSSSTDAQIGILGADKLIDNAESVFLYETNSDTLMYAWNADVEMIPSSLVKIMTALLAVESERLSDAVTVKQSVLDTIPKDAVSAKLVADEVITLEDLVHCMMVGSANDAAAMIAEHLGGDQASFVQMMNNRAAEIGCTGTVFTNAHGIQDNTQHTTARDIAKILEVAIENEKFEEFFGTVYYVVGATNKSDERNMLTGNYMITQDKDDVRIYYDSRVTGGRTGVNNDGKRCLAAVSESNGMKLISVVMGAQSTYHEESLAIKAFGGYNETRELLDLGYGGYKTSQVLYEGQVLLQRDVLNGSGAVSLGSDISVSAVLPENVTKDLLTYKFSNLDMDIMAPVEKGEKLSDVEVWYGGLCVAKADVYAMNSVAVAKPLIVEKGNDSFTWLDVAFLVVLCVVAVIALLYLRNWRKRTPQKHQKRMKNCRRSR